MCTNQEYVENQVRYSEKIILDTSSAMEDGFPLFIKNIKNLLLDNEVKITILKNVQLELESHCNSDKQNKCEAAKRAKKVIEENFELFDFEINDNRKIYNTFADNIILSNLAEGITSKRQLLITNDNRLSCDAYNLNKFESINGYKIHVCYLNKFGEMNKCRCAFEPYDHNVHDNVKVKVVEKIVKEKSSAFNTYVKPACVALGTCLIVENRQAIKDFLGKACYRILDYIA